MNADSSNNDSKQVAFIGLGVMGFHMAGHLANVGHQQVELIRRFRDKRTRSENVHGELVPLLVSINCVAAGLGWTA